MVQTEQTQQCVQAKRDKLQRPHFIYLDSLQSHAPHLAKRESHREGEVVLWDEDASHKVAKFAAQAVYHGQAQAQNGKQLLQRLTGRKTPGQQDVPSPLPPS